MIQQVFNQVDNLNRESIPNLITADHKASNSLQVISYARTFGNGSLLPIRLSISTPRPMPTTRVLQHGVPKEAPSQRGKNLAHCYGFTESVHISLQSGLDFSLTTSGLIAGSGKSILRYATPCRVASQSNSHDLIYKLRHHP